MPDDPTNWKRACDALYPTCPFCGNASPETIERRGHQWHCAEETCGRSWDALNAMDRRFLRSLRITQEG